MRFDTWRNAVIATRKLAPVTFGMRQSEIMNLFGEPDATSTMVEKGRPLILKYMDIEFHFDSRYGHTLFLVYSEEAGLDILDQEYSRHD